MSKAKDRARAESGLIFRDGRYWKKEDWYALHPSREVRAARQEQVDKAVAERWRRSLKISLISVVSVVGSIDLGVRYMQTTREQHNEE